MVLLGDLIGRREAGDRHVDRCVLRPFADEDLDELSQRPAAVRVDPDQVRVFFGERAEQQVAGSLDEAVLFDVGRQVHAVQAPV